jgi:hypothetical protein
MAYTAAAAPIGLPRDFLRKSLDRIELNGSKMVVRKEDNGRPSLSVSWRLGIDLGVGTSGERKRGRSLTKLMIPLR